MTVTRAKRWERFDAMTVEQCHAECPNRKEHSPGPSGFWPYMAWVDAMVEMGWEQVRCDDCGRYFIWLPPTEAKA